MSTIINQGHVSPSSLIMAQILPGYDGLDYGDRIIQQTRFSSVNTSRFATPDAALIATYFHMTPKIAERTATSTRFCSIPRSGLQCGLTGRKLRTYHHDSDRHKHLRVNVFADQMTSQVTSPSGDKAAMVFSTDFHYTDVYPMISPNNGKECAHTLREFIRNDGIPDLLVTDYNSSFIGRNTPWWYKTCQQKLSKQLILSLILIGTTRLKQLVGNLSDYTRRSRMVCPYQENIGFICSDIALIFGTEQL